MKNKAITDRVDDCLNLFPPDVRRDLLELRRDIHRHPELAFQEIKTAERLEKALRKLGVESIRRVAGTGIVARIPGRDSTGPVVAIRGDIDALPIQENTGLEYSSETPGVMHACGHDVHATWTVAAGFLLSQKPAQGGVLLVLQPAEEVGRGALKILESGALDDARAIIGGHVDRRYAVGEVVAQDGSIAASSDEFEIRLLGRGAHAARPKEAIDPIVGGSALVQALQSVVSTHLGPDAPAVVTVGSFHAGTASNIIPETSQIRGIIRALDDAARAKLLKGVREVVESTARARGLQPTVTMTNPTPPLVNDASVIRHAQEAVRSVLGSGAVVPLYATNLAAEDFAFYLRAMPGCFLRIGAREESGQFHPAHSPQFFAAESSVFVGGAVLAETARRLSTHLGSA